MKKSIKILIVGFGVSLFSFLGYQVSAKISSKTKIENTLQTLPDFLFENLKGKAFTNKDLKKKQQTIFIYFNSGCDYCQNEAKLIKEHIDKFNNVQLIFVSIETIDEIKTFSKQYQLDNYDNITFLSDKRDDFTTRFGATSVPYLLIYDQDQKLIKKHKGQLTISGLQKALK